MWLILIYCFTALQNFKIYFSTHFHENSGGYTGPVEWHSPETPHFINSGNLWISADVNWIHLSVPQPIRWPMAEAALIIWSAYQIYIWTGWEQSIVPPIWTHFTSEFLSHSQSQTRKDVLLVCVHSDSYWKANRL